MDKPAIGQEAVVSGYGLGRVQSYSLETVPIYVEVKPYVCGYSMKFSPENVKLVAINYEKET